ncbi:unnamed protein product [Mycena citricolor]|uniref:Transmembrane protein n=1 Tax=Mycena citricolor TaxID=2018698 RepID=A0AAD2HCX8_9AGAR|nr:unnamed protein product [Mycena citricolor]
MLAFFLLPLPFLHLVEAFLNVTVDDTDSSIGYIGTWEPSSSHQSPLDFGGSHTFSSDDSGKAVFTFTGVAVYYLAPRWPYAVSTRLSLDNGIATLVNLTDPDASTTPPGGSESTFSSVAWSAFNLSNSTHSVVATVGIEGFIIVDGFMQVQPIDGFEGSSATPSSIASQSSSSVTSATPTASQTSPVSIKSNLNVGLGVAFGVFVFIGAFLLCLILYQRRREKRARSARPKPLIDDWGPMFDSEYSRGSYAAVPLGHAYEASGRLLPVVDPWEPDEHHRKSLGSISGPSSPPARSRSNIPALSRILPPGAMDPAVPGPYIDRPPPTPTYLFDSDPVHGELSRSGTVGMSLRSSEGVSGSDILFTRRVHDGDDAKPPAYSVK